MDKNSILKRTNNGLEVFKHFLGNRFVRLGQAFKSPFYDDKNAACHIYQDRKSGVYRYKDFGDAQYTGDCFDYVGKIFHLSCSDKDDFRKILEIINESMVLGLRTETDPFRTLPSPYKKKVIKARELKSIHDDFETIPGKNPVRVKPFSDSELRFWGKYGIDQMVLEKFKVISIELFKGIGKSGKEYILKSSQAEPIFGYQGRKYVKLYRPFSSIRFLYTGELTENYVFGYDQLPLRGDMIFITGGEKDVLSLYSQGFSSISMNSETASIPKNLLRGLSYRFKHLVLLYDCDKTGIESMKKLKNDHKQFGLKMLILPLSGDKKEKDISDFFAKGFTGSDLKMLFIEMLEEEYGETLSIIKTCEVDLRNPPVMPESIVSINEISLGSPGNILCLTGSEGSGKSNYLGGIISGAISSANTEVDSLGTTVMENSTGKAILFYDTEQSEYQLFKNLNRILIRANRQASPPWFKSFSLVGVARSERMKIIFESMDKFYYEFGGIHMVIIDGIADLLGSVNDEVASVTLIEELFRLSAIYQTLIVGVLHMSPSGMKLRGHLGSEVQRKAAGILLIEKEQNHHISTVKALKVRDGSPFDVPLIEFGWDKELERHVYLGVKSKEDNNSRKLSDLTEVVQELFTQHQQLSYSDLMIQLKTILNVKDRMARNYIKFLKDNGVIESSNQFPGQIKLSSKK